MSSYSIQALVALILPPLGLLFSQSNPSSDPWSMWADRGVLAVVCATSWALIKDLMKQMREERRHYDQTINAVHGTLLAVVEKNNTVLTEVRKGIEGMEERSFCVRDEEEEDPRKRRR